MNNLFSLSVGSIASHQSPSSPHIDASKTPLYPPLILRRAGRRQPISCAFLMGFALLIPGGISSGVCVAQIPSVSDTIKTPVPGAAHDYIQDHVETVNPADGTVSIRIGVPLPPSRGLNIPFGFAYDSGGAYYFGPNSAGGATLFSDLVTPLAQGGWSYTAPTLSVQHSSFQAPYDTSTTGVDGGAGVQDCDVFSDYVFQSPSGNRQNLGLTMWWSTNSICAQVGAEGPVTNSLTPYGSTSGSYQAITDPYWANGAFSNPVDVLDADGTDYSFPSAQASGNVCSIPTACSGVVTASSVTDRNGNSISIHSNLGQISEPQPPNVPGVGGPFLTYTDTIGRTALNVNTFGGSPDIITVSGLSQPYLVTWESVQGNYQINLNYVSPQGVNPPNRCLNNGLYPSGSGPFQPSIQAVRTITLPNNQQYVFEYDPIYGTVSKITYPGGGYVKYVWGPNPLSAFTKFPYMVAEVVPGSTFPVLTYNVLGGYCEYQHDQPAVLKRYVYHTAGADPAEEQDFTYSTTWSNQYYFLWQQKQTTVVTKDLIRGTSYKTVYTYGGVAPDGQPNTTSVTLGQIPVETQVQYYDTSGSLLQTVFKSYQNERLLTQEQTRWATNQTSETDWTYNTNEMLTEKDEYDFGRGGALPDLRPIPPINNGGTRGALLRKTIVPSYHTFSAGNTYYYAYTVSHIVDKPDSVQVEDGNSNVFAGVSYIYDTTTNQITNNPSANLLSRSNWLNQTGSSFVTTSHTYDGFGNLHTTTDPNQNVTMYNYTDSFADTCASTVSLPSSAYLTSIVYPTINGITHTEKFKYNCATGDLAASTDENSQTTSYVYNTPPSGCSYTDGFNRLSEIDYPDGGKTFHCYNDAAPTPAVATTRLMNTSGQAEQSSIVMDGLGNPIQTQRIVGPSQTVLVDSVYDGDDRLLSVSNPYLSTQDPTYGVTTFVYDPLGRKTGQLQSDGISSLTWQYTGTMVDSWDEAGVHMEHTLDALGRLVQVNELGTASNPLSLTTSYVYNPNGNLLCVDQWGSRLPNIPCGASPGSDIQRQFAYDLLSRLVTSSNPETGSINYSYLMGNNLCAGDVSLPCSKTDSQNVTTTYNYDSLNRLISRSAPAISVTGSTNGQTVPAINDQYVYDVATVGDFTAQNPIGRLVEQSNGYNASTQFSYDSMGRILLQTNVLPDSDGTDLTVNPISATYDLAGNLTDLTYPEGRHIHQTFDSAGRLGQPGQNAVADMGTGLPYLQSISYNADSSPQTMTFGNGVAQTITENNRLQIQSLVVNSPSGSPLSPAAVQPLLSHTYCYAGCTPVAGGSAGTANNGNIWQIADGLKPATNTQDFTYDGLNRIQSFSLGGVLKQFYWIDCFGNMSPASSQTGSSGCAKGTPLYTFDPATNRISNLPCVSAATSSTGYDASGNQLCSMDSSLGTSLYSYDADSRISQINTLNSASPFASYVYGADGSRVRKDKADGTFTEYVYFGGKVISERDDAYQWTDYIFAGDRRIARLRAEDLWLGTLGTDPNNPSGATWTVPTPANADGSPYTVKAGDQMCVRQLNTTAVVSGPFVTFSNGMSSSGWPASDGSPLGALTGGWPSTWDERCADLSGGGATTGASITSLGVNTATSQSGSVQAGYAIYADWAIVSTDGTVTPITLTPTSGPQTPTVNAGTGMPYMDNAGANGPLSAHYFIADHLGTAQLEIAEGGWPVYSGQFAPFGQEMQNGRYLPQTQADGSTSNYKFTGKERDAESGLDYFGARYYGSNMGRWMSPDWSAGKPQPVPYAKLANPQSLNLYSYVGNNPLSRADADGHFWRELWNAIRSGCGCWQKDYETAQFIANSKQLQREQETLKEFNGHMPQVRVGIVFWFPLAEGPGARATTVLGHYPDYVNMAEAEGANYFNVPTAEWNAMTETEQWETNQKFLDDAIARGDQFKLATPIDQVKPGSFYEKELKYLADQGYTLNGDGTMLVPNQVLIN